MNKLDFPTINEHGELSKEYLTFLQYIKLRNKLITNLFKPNPIFTDLKISKETYGGRI